MAINATGLFCAHPDEQRLTDTQCAHMCNGVTYIRTADESKELTPERGPMTSISASGMLTGGHILYHLRTVAPNHRHHRPATTFPSVPNRPPRRPLRPRRRPRTHQLACLHTPTAARRPHGMPRPPTSQTDRIKT